MMEVMQKCNNTLPMQYSHLMRKGTEIVIITLLIGTSFGKIATNSPLNPIFDGTFTLKYMKDIVVRRIRIEKKTTEAIKCIKVKSFNSFVITAIYEKLERDFKIKQNCPF